MRVRACKQIFEDIDMIYIVWYVYMCSAHLLISSSLTTLTIIQSSARAVFFGASSDLLLFPPHYQLRSVIHRFIYPFYLQILVQRKDPDPSAEHDEHRIEGLEGHELQGQHRRGRRRRGWGR